jgi:hypothetical protein
MLEFAELDWDLAKAAMRSIVYDPNGGPDAIMNQISTAMTTWAVPGVQARMERSGDKKVESESSKNDPRKLRNLGVTLQGEKHTASYFDTVIIFRELPQGWTISTHKDRERPYFTDEVVTDVGFADTYSSITKARIV